MTRSAPFAGLARNQVPPTHSDMVTIPPHLSRNAFESASDVHVSQLCLDLARCLHAALASAPDWTQAAYALVDELRDMEHDLWSFDDNSPDFQVWCGDWSRPRASGELLLELANPAAVRVTWRGAAAEPTSAVWPIQSQS